jgi:hypothetical protein
MLTECIREAIRAAGMSRYAISKATGVDRAQLGRFLQGRPGGLSFGAVDKVLDCLGLMVEIRARNTREGE